MRFLDPYGSIVVVSQLLDPQGRNPKDRRCIVVTPAAADLGLEDMVQVIAITSVVPDPLPTDCVPLPWQLPYHPVTRLHKPSVAVCGWVATVEVGRILRPLGKIPTRTMLQIARVLLTQVSPEPPQPAPDQPPPI